MCMMLQVVTLVDLAGHERYFKTTAYGLTGHLPDYACLIVGANAGMGPALLCVCVWGAGEGGGGDCNFLYSPVIFSRACAALAEFDVKGSHLEVLVVEAWSCACR